MRFEDFDRDSDTAIAQRGRHARGVAEILSQTLVRRRKPAAAIHHTLTKGLSMKRLIVYSICLFALPASSCLKKASISSRTPADSFGQLVRPAVRSLGSDITTGLISYYAFEENTKDDSGNGNNGSVVGNAIYRSGKVGACFYFDGNSHIIFSEMFVFHQNADATIAFWINPHDGNHRTIAWSKLVAQDDNRFHLYSGLPEAGNPGFGMDYRQADGTLHSLYQGSIPAGQWTHIAVTKTGNIYHFYKNADAVADSTDAAPILPTSSDGWELGHRSDGCCGQFPWATNFMGALDEIRIYNRALTQVEVQALYRYLQ
jgi:hypothetical protein